MAEPSNYQKGINSILPDTKRQKVLQKTTSDSRTLHISRNVETRISIIQKYDCCYKFLEILLSYKNYQRSTSVANVTKRIIHIYIENATLDLNHLRKHQCFPVRPLIPLHVLHTHKNPKVGKLTLQQYSPLIFQPKLEANITWYCNGSGRT